MWIEGFRVCPVSWKASQISGNLRSPRGFNGFVSSWYPKSMPNLTQPTFC